MNGWLSDFFFAYAWMNVFFVVVGNLWAHGFDFVRHQRHHQRRVPKMVSCEQKIVADSWVLVFFFSKPKLRTIDDMGSSIYIIRNQRALRGRMISHVSMTRGFSVLFRTIDYYCWAIAGIVASLGWRKDFRENPANESGRSNQTSQPTSRSNKKSIQSSRWREKPSIYCTVWHFFFHDWPSLLASVYNRFTIQVYE